MAGNESTVKLNQVTLGPTPGTAVGGIEVQA